MGSSMYICLLVLTVSVYFANSQAQRHLPQPNNRIFGTGNTPQGGSGQCPLNQQALQMCTDFCTRQGCQPRPCTQQTGFTGCRCWNCQRPNMPNRPNRRYYGSFDRSDMIPDRSDMYPDRSDMIPDWY